MGASGAEEIKNQETLMRLSTVSYENRLSVRCHCSLGWISLLFEVSLSTIN